MRMWPPRYYKIVPLKLRRGRKTVSLLWVFNFGQFKSLLEIINNKEFIGLIAKTTS